MFTPPNLSPDAFLCDVVSYQIVGQETMVLTLKPRDAQQSCGYPPGAHLELQLEAGPRQYSLCSHDAAHYRLAIRCEIQGRGGSLEVFERARQHEPLWVRGPFNHFDSGALHAAARVKLIAGGIGITPILAMAHALDRQKQPFELHYSARHADEMVFSEEIRSLASGQPQSIARLYASKDPGGSRPDLADILGPFDAGTQVYICGPNRMIEALQDAAFALGWPDEHIHFERFSADAPVPQPGDTAFEILIASTEQKIRVEREQTVADALADAGITIPISCAAGVCGSCRTRILAGTPDHRDLFFTPEEQARNDEFTPCCSRSHSSVLMLDL